MILDSISTPACVKDKVHTHRQWRIPSWFHLFYGGWQFWDIATVEEASARTSNLGWNWRLQNLSRVPANRISTLNLMSNQRPPQLTSIMVKETLLRLMVALRVATAWEWVRPSRQASFTLINRSPFYNKGNHILINISQFRTRQHLMNYAKVHKGCEQFIYFYELEKSGSCKYLLQLKNAIDTIDDGTIL